MYRPTKAMSQWWNADLDGPVPAELAIVFRIPKHEVINRMVVAGNREVIQISMASDEIRVRGGRLFLVEAPAN